ncbi:hypothetical protein H072_9831 [Dactylellina haptotyla CBS 200.50]|uniref:Uncharacterized protein n=1 Tax=Dactylellina haptotyla (strain CBS 200.50) TaxID=1284197 RepID=S8A660_DACHA|nr:hypothetical protein H072_9831 [Dactylellina haptotyla CBS 200.50]
MNELQAKQFNFLRAFFESLATTMTSYPRLVAAGSGGLGSGLTIQSLLAALGFTSSGPVAGSLAATWQSSIGNVVAGSLFSQIQIIAMLTGRMALLNTNLGLAAVVFIFIGFIVSDLAQNEEFRNFVEEQTSKLWETISNIAGQIGPWFQQIFLESLKTTMQSHPRLFTIAAGAIVTATTLPATLAALGFGATGVATGSLAAAWQSSIGNVVSSSLFSEMQSIAMLTGRTALIGAGIGLAAMAFIVIGFTIIDLAQSEEFKALVDQEMKKFGETIGGLAATVSTGFHSWLNSPQVRGLGEAVGSTAVQIGVGAHQFASSPEVQGHLENTRRFGENAAKNVALSWGQWMGGGSKL